MYRAQMKTVGEYPLDEVASALQKSIRRGSEEDAMFWALELMDSGMGQYLWRRLMIIAAEDIGIANLPLFNAVVNAWQATQTVTKSWKEPASEFLGMIVLAMCRSPKCREGDDFTWYMMERRKQGLKLEVPDYALDYHTDRGRRMKRGEAYWLEEASKLNDDVTPEIAAGAGLRAGTEPVCYGKLVREFLAGPQPFLSWPPEEKEAKDD